MVDKRNLICLLLAYQAMKARGADFAVTVNDRALLFGPRWHSANRRYDLAIYAYQSWYARCSPEERSAFYQLI